MFDRNTNKRFYNTLETHHKIESRQRTSDYRTFDDFDSRFISNFDNDQRDILNIVISRMQLNPGDIKVHIALDDVNRPVANSFGVSWTSHTAVNRKSAFWDMWKEVKEEIQNAAA